MESPVAPLPSDPMNGFLTAEGWDEIDVQQLCRKTFPTPPTPDPFPFASPIDIFLHIIDEALIEQCTQQCQSLHNRTRDIYMMYGLRCLLHCTTKPNVPKGTKNIFQTEYAALRKHLIASLQLSACDKVPIIMGFTRFQYLFNHVKISDQIASNTLSQNMVQLSFLGEHILLDPRWRHYYHLPRATPQCPTIPKDHILTHVITEIKSTQYPIVIGFYPHWNGLPDPLPLWNWLQNLVPSSTLTYCEGMYLSHPQYLQCNALSIPWISLYKPEDIFQCKYQRRESALHSAQSPSAEIRWNAHSHLIHIHYKDVIKYHRPLHILSNLCERSPPTRPFRCAPLITSIHSRYQLAHKFHTFVKQHGWPFSRRSWDKYMDAHYFTCILANCYHIWTSILQETDTTATFPQFCTQLGNELVRYALSIPFSTDNTG